ncbi:MAG: anthranilate synthase component I family protein, partial [Candidatus Syntropharchaeia archaeon]
MEVVPTKKEFISVIEREEKPLIAQVCMRFRNEIEPLDAYISLRSNYSYLLESVEKGEKHARFSFVGSDPEGMISIERRRVRVEGKSNMMKYVLPKIEEITENGRIKNEFDTIDALRAAFPRVKFIGNRIFPRQTFFGGMIGFLAYDIVYDWLEVERKDSHVPDAQFIFITKALVFDHATDDAYVILTPFVSEDDDPGKVYEDALSDGRYILSRMEKSSRNGEFPDDGKTELFTNMKKEEYERAVSAAKKHIFDGDIFQVVLSRRYEGEISSSSLEIYRALREVNPSPYMYIFEFSDLGIIGSSPETLMTVYNGKVYVNPIAGTCPRGRTPEEDKELARRMLEDEKERAEHVMLVDLGRNDVRIVSIPGSVKVEDFMSVIKYSHVQHIESTVSGELRDDLDVFHATRAIFPAGTLSGAPKRRAMEII